jgi:hypothetical protein
VAIFVVHNWRGWDRKEDDMSHHIKGEAKKAATKKPAKKGSKKK